ncbi:DUF2523 family protein [Vibrio parahaemolyticus]|uniref:DUF2523 family protein n=1 Tax=Vibrio parahaemolyticus TaxID=670 RepID=UPI00112428CD|nr:DUF2523 family protein [Vibrio parahaemolyticus]TOK50305.1 hypothetical protein CGI17_24555 [Vibrio parahaemolyticus]TOK79613.1 hypothetical protein CGI10_24515 [Vibrio parahaemolyticus]
MARILAFLFLTVIPLLPQLISAVLTRAAISLGFGTATFVGLNLLFESVIAKLSASTSGLPAEVIQMIGLIGIDDAFNIMLSAGFALLTFKGLTRAGGARVAVWRKPGDKNPIDWGA